MRTIKSLLILGLVLAATGVESRPPDGWKTPKDTHPGSGSQQVGYRANCNQATQGTDLDINNVRARLLNGGDMWWDLNKGKYIVPKVPLGQPEVSSIFAGSVWLGGKDPGGNLKMACQLYRSASANDFWPGPLDPNTGQVDQATCKLWDKFFRVSGANIRKHKANAEFHKLRGEPYPPEEIPKDVKGWPARGNAYFQEINDFALPNTNQGLALFFDTNQDGEYQPEDGDYPVIDVKGCPATTFPDEMIFWIYNDAGNSHTQTKASPIQMEVQVQAFGYSTQDELNDMTFYRYKLINRAVEEIDSTFFAIWIDPDLGCSDDDYIGCDTVFVKIDTCNYEDADGNPKVKYRNRRRDLMYVYNQDAVDGISGCNCSVNGSNTNTYCNNVPILGVDYFRGPLDEDGCELGMNSFVYWLRESNIGGMTDPGVDVEFYNYLTGSWKDGTPFTIGGSGYNLGSTNRTNFALGSPPNDPNGWSMCTANLPKGDQRTLQASGPFSLGPGKVNELIVGVPWVPNIQYPCPDLEPLLYADRLAQGLFDNCFKVIDGPTAPDLDFVELNRQLVVTLSNNLGSNNYKENYLEVDFQAPSGLPLDQKSYKFEGYKVYQVHDPSVTRAELIDPDKARIVYQCDIKNNVGKIFNWEPTLGPGGNSYWTPVEKIDGNNAGVGHSFSITEDQFASGARQLINHKKYYYVAIAYAYNNFADFDPLNPTSGQRNSYLEGRLNIKTYTVIPRPITDRAMQSAYGDGPEISAYAGSGAGHVAVELKANEYDSILAGNNVALDYTYGRGPISVKVYDPLNVKDGEFDLFVTDDNLTDDVLDPNARWTLVNTVTHDTIYSDRTLARLNEQLIAEYGFSVTVAQTADAGDKADKTNGGIDQWVTFADPANEWIGALPESPEITILGATPFHFCANQPPAGVEYYYLNDPDQGLTTFGNKWFVPYYLTWNPKPQSPQDFKISPRWSPPSEAFSKSTNAAPNGLDKLNNVDIILTKDKSKWSRCLVVETASDNYTGSSGLGFLTEGDTTTLPANTRWVRKSFDTRYRVSVGKDDNNGDGLPDPDGEMINGKPVRGMGWFPGYAVDVETGERLNVFFGENSIYNGKADGGQNWPDEPANGADMMFNPSDVTARQITNQALFNPYSFPMGGQHFIYVTRQKYDGCADMLQWLEPDNVTTSSKKYTNKIKAIPNITWTALMLLPPGKKMLSYAEGLIPNETVMHIRVDNPYGVYRRAGDGHPHYKFKIEGKAATQLDEVAIANALDSVKMVPNPYYGYSAYETSQFTNIVKISNLPAKCTVTIYSLDGKFIRQYNRDEIPQVDPERVNPPIAARQIYPDVEWDMKNSKGIPVASGVYLVHIDAPGMGERTLKWFGVGREFDPSGL